MVTIACERLDVVLRGRRVLDRVECRIEPGMLVGLIGPNGAGKSTLARALVNLVAPTGGRVTIDGRDAASLGEAALARTIAYLPQGSGLHWPLSVERLVGLGRLPHLAPLSRIGSADAAAVERAMAATATFELRTRVATELSGGERARVMLARALATEAPVLLADEPLASLDPGHQIEVMTLLADRARAGTTVVVVLHDLSIAARFCERLLVLAEGRLVADGTPADVLNAEMLARVYGITAWQGEIAGRAAVVPVARSGAGTS